MLEVENISVGFKAGPFAPRRQVLSNISFQLGRGESLAIVGRSGSGKTTVANAVLGLIPCQSGAVLLDGKPVCGSHTRATLARRIQLVSQNPQTSFDPDLTLAQSLKEVLCIHRLLPKGMALEEKVEPLLADVGLQKANLNKPPRHFSGGELQRLSLVRALLPAPQVLIFDEADSMLDTAIRLELFDLLNGMRRKYALSYLYITHDLRVLPHLADRVLVLEDGRVVEQGPVALLHQSDNAFVRELQNAVAMDVCVPCVSA